MRYASKKASSSTRNAPINTRPKHRGWRVQDGHYVKESTILATQLKPRFHPGLYASIILILFVYNNHFQSACSNVFIELYINLFHRLVWVKMVHYML